MARKLDGSKSIQSGTITSTQLSSSVTASIEAGGGPRISGLIYPGDDTAANTVGGQTIYLTGSGFDSNAEVYINGSAVPSVSFISASNVGFTTPALSAATYPVYLINPDDGATAILVPGISISGEPTWVTSAGLAEQDATGTWNISLSATGDAPLTYALAAGSSLPGGITLASNGVISGTITTPPETDTTYNFTVVASDAQNQDSSRAFSVTASTGEGVLFANNVLLIHADGTNNGNNHTFVDSSNNNFTITRFGNATQGSYSPFSQTGWSAYFDGSGDYLAIPNTSANFGSGDFTIECWFYKTGSTNVVISNQDGGSDTNYFVLDADNAQMTFQIRDGSGQAYAYGPAVANNTWNHVAVTRANGTVRVFVNGVSGNTATITKSVTSRQTIIGAFLYTGFEGYWSGYISNVHIVKGTALYTSNFAKPTAPAVPANANTSLLALQSNRLIDDGPNNFTLTRNGDVNVQAFSPFAPGLLSSNSHSVYFDGNGDSLTYTGGSSINFGTGDFTIELFAYMTNTGTFSAFLRPDDEGAFPEFGYDWSTSELKFQARNGAIVSVSTTAVLANAWNHIVACRSGTSLRLFVNGTQVGTTTTNSTNFTSPANAIRIGGSSFSGTHSVNGHISNFRIVKGTSLYTSNFTIPTSPLTAVSNTSLLTCQSTTFIDNSTNAFTITPNGNVVPRKFNPFGQTYTATAYSTANVGGSVYVDGSGDYLTLSANVTPRGTEDFTIEFWFYPLSVASAERYFVVGGASGSLIFGIANSGNDIALIQDISGTVVANFGSRTQLIASVWNHVVVTRNGNNFRCFINGVLTSSGVVTSSYSFATPSSTTLLTASTFGYVSNMRINRGTALYTSTFTPPSAPVTNVANTQLLLNFTNAQIFDQTAKNVLECVGDAKVSTAQYKYGTASMHFDGTGDYLVTQSSALNALGSGDFTIEMWLYPSNTNSAYRAIIASDAYAATTNGWTVYQNGTSIEMYYSSGGSTPNIFTATSALTSSVWQHFALVRSSGTLKAYVNGTQVASVSNSINFVGDKIFIGDNNAGDYFFNGYIDDLRITKGYARYTANFTAPTAKFKDK